MEVLTVRVVGKGMLSEATESVEEWVMLKIKLEVIGQVLSPLISVQSMSDCFLASTGGVSSLLTEMQSHGAVTLYHSQSLFNSSILLPSRQVNS